MPRPRRGYPKVLVPYTAKANRVMTTKRKTAPTVKKLMLKVKDQHIAKVAERVLRQHEETKCAYNLTLAEKVDIKGAGLNYGGGTTIGYAANIMPQITLGTSEQHRVGNKVRSVSLQLRYSILAKPTTDSGTPAGSGGNINPYMSLPFLVKVIVYRHKYSLSDASHADIIDAGNAAAAITGDIDTFFRPFNRDEYYIAYSKIHKMQAPRHIGGGPSIYNQSIDPRYTSMLIRKLKLKLPSMLTFNDTGAYAANAGWYLGVAVCNEDGSAIAAIDTRCTFNAESYLYFTDL